jgi:L-alanine-DL-glutamate epimerase-like enolase superfamily enzyme
MTDRPADQAATRISEIQAVDLDIPYDPPFRPAWQPGAVVSSRWFTLVRVTTEAGVNGWAGTDGHHAATVDRDVTPYLVGQDAAAAQRHARVLRNAGDLWFIDMAFWDIIGQVAGLPLYRLWGAARDCVRAYASSCEQGTPADRAALARHYAGLGFRAMKLRFHHERIEDDLEALDAVRTAVPHLAVMVDANQATCLPAPEPGVVWDYRRALRTASELEKRGVLWLEEPLARYDFDTLARLRTATPLDIAGGEYNRGLHEFRWMIERGVYDIIQGDGTVSESVSQIRKAAAMAEMFGRKFVPHHGLSGLGLAAMLHLACSIPGPTWLELMYEPPGRTIETYQQLGGILRTAIQVDSDGRVRPPQAPGLGIAVDETLIPKYTVNQ